MITSNKKNIVPIEARKLARQYLSHLLKAERREAIACIVDSVESGADLKDIYIKVLQPAMYEVGRLWQMNEIDIAVEHYITAATQLTMAHLFPYALSEKRVKKSMVGGCLGSELHELGLRMVSDLFEYEGWDTYFMGAVTPDQSFLQTIENQNPDVVCLSLTMQFGVPQVKELIDTIRHTMKEACPKILVGGLVFIMNPNLAYAVGADGMGVDAIETIYLANKLVVK